MTKSTLLTQYDKLKVEYPDALLLFRIGDFYETFDADADTLANVLGVTKTTCGERRMAGFPQVQLDRYVSALVQAGYQVAVAEPVFDKPYSKPQTVYWKVP